MSTRCAPTGQRHGGRFFSPRRLCEAPCLSSILWTFLSASCIGLAAVPVKAALTRDDRAPKSNFSANEIRLRLESVQQPVRISGFDLRFTGEVVAHDRPSALRPFRRLTLTWEKEPGEPTPLWTVRDEMQVLAHFHSREFRLEGSELRMGLKHTPSRLILTENRSHRQMDLIAQMNIEEYLRGVLPSEMPSQWPLEALKAQAVAARTYALFRANQREFDGKAYHLEAGTSDQVYLSALDEEMRDPAPRAGSAAGPALSSYQARLRVQREAVRTALLETRGEVLLDLRDKPIAAYFHADCGGQTEEASHVWGGSDESSGVAKDDGCPASPLARWKTKLAPDLILAKLRKYDAALGLSANRLAKLALLDIEPGVRWSSGRVKNLKLNWSDRSQTLMSGHEFRMALGPDLIRSANFEISRDGTMYSILGRGYGHGVGLCQWGARHLAQTGTDYREILGHYYPKAHLGQAGSAPAVVARSKGEDNLQ